MMTSDKKINSGVIRVQFDCEETLHEEICEFRHKARHGSMRSALEALLRAGLGANSSSGTKADT